MVLESFDALKKQLSSTASTPKRVVVANASDEHTLSAVMSLYKEGILIPVLIGEKSVILELLEKMAVSSETIKTLDIIDIAGDTEIAEKAVSVIRDGDGDVLMLPITTASAKSSPT